jgi:AraC-like DNA-binding protein
MKPSGIGRILFWSGGSLWIGRSEAPTDFHSHHAVQISLSFSEKGLQLSNHKGSWFTYKAAIVAAHQKHALEAGGLNVGMIFVEPESLEGQALGRRCLEEGIVSIADGTIEHEIAALFKLYQNKVANHELVDAAKTIVAALTASSTVKAITLDKRIKRAKEFIREHIGGTVLLTDTAEAVCLSPDRFRHLFIEQTGIRFRPYVLWLRIEVALAAYVGSKNLTEASQVGGFADSAHFSRTFRRLFGMAPSSIQLE